MLTGVSKPADPTALVCLTGCLDSPRGAVVRMTLHAAGIHALLQAEQHRALLGPFGGYIEPRVLVRQSDLEVARELLEDGGQPPVSEGAPPSPSEEREDLAWLMRLRSRRRTAGLLALLLFLHPLSGDFIVAGLMGGDLFRQRVVPKHLRLNLTPPPPRPTTR